MGTHGEIAHYHRDHKQEAQRHHTEQRTIPGGLGQHPGYQSIRETAGDAYCGCRPEPGQRLSWRGTTARGVGTVAQTICHEDSVMLSEEAVSILTI
jgi:hypothetical protein